MKKTYIQPSIESFTVQTHNHLLNVSNVTVSGDDYNGGTIKARGFDFEFMTEDPVTEDPKKTNEFEDFEDEEDEQV